MAFCVDLGPRSRDQWIYPFASAIDTDLPEPPSRVHLMLGSKANWVTPQVNQGRVWSCVWCSARRVALVGLQRGSAWAES